MVLNTANWTERTAMADDCKNKRLIRSTSWDELGVVGFEVAVEPN